MSISPAIHEVFGHFQNLNLLVLLHDLGSGQTARRSWYASGQLCPVAHGLAGGQQVRQLKVLGQGAELEDGCDFAARQLGANPAAVLRFVRSWDEEVHNRQWLLRQLEALWTERLEDAETMQAILEVCGDDSVTKEAGVQPISA
jgi:hypothetical protein